MIKVCKWIRYLSIIRNYAKNPYNSNAISEEMKYLNVAEKNDAAKTIAALLSNGTANRREGYSVYNKIYEFEATVKGSKSKMVMTSVSGHLLTQEFLQSYRNWKNVDPISLFDAPVRKACPDDYQPIKRTLEREIRSCGGLIIWTDCDREGENIGMEIVQVCRAIKSNITVYRAIFSEITTPSVRRALQQLKVPDQRQSDAVDIRSELDLRSGAAITRFQTMRLQRLFPVGIADKLISYGSCQIPTLGFVAERYKEIEAFVSEPFWKIKVTHTIDDLTVEFNWERNRLFDKQTCEDYFLLCITDPKATVEIVTVKPKSKWRPTPMDTVELEKLGSRKLKLSAKETMTIAEKLYTKGYISYPRTETNQFSKEMDLRSLVEQQTGHNNWGTFATRVLEWGPNPRNGNKSDQAHPPIHPTKLVADLSGNEARVYELVCRHFLACVSKDAVGRETVVKINIAGEKFTATGLVILERNYLDVYVYDKWNAKQIHNYVIGQVFEPTEITMPEGATSPPALLTEADLIALMEKHGIGTDATHAEHINTIKERGYIGVTDNGFLVPGVIGMGLYEGYDAMQLALAKPVLRAEFEADLKKICLGEKDPKLVLSEQIVKYKEAYKQIMEKITAMDEKMALRINETPTARTANSGDSANENYENNPNRLQEVFKCPKCNVAPMALKQKKNQTGYFIGCLNFPDCKNVVWLPTECLDPSVKDEFCQNCGEGYKLLKFKFSTAYFKALFNAPSGWYKTCLRCDTKFRETFDINLENVKQVGTIVGTTASNTLQISTAGGLNSGTNSNSNRHRSSNSTSNSGNGVDSTKKPGPSRKKKTSGNAATVAQPKTTTKSSTTRASSTTNSNIRSYFTDAPGNSRQTVPSQTPLTTAVLNDIEDIFNSNDDSFDVLVPANRNEPTSNASENTDFINDINSDIAVAFENDDDWMIDVSNNSSSNKRINATSEQQNESSSTNRLFANMDDSISEIFRAEPIDFNTISWGSGNRKIPDRNEPEKKKPRLQTAPKILTNTSPVVDSPGCSTSNANYSWGSVERTVTNSSHSVKCSGCHQEAKELSVKKDGPNKGKTFYVCPKDQQRCNFFQWADAHGFISNTSTEDNLTQPTTSSRASQNSWSSQSRGLDSDSGWGITTSNTASSNNARTNMNTSIKNSIEKVNCNCGIEASSLTVRKEGPNKGRSFFGCSQRSCKFFQWGDDGDNKAVIENMSWGTSGRQQPSTSGNTNNERESKKRKCGLCRQEGHTKLKCPRKAELDFFS